MERKKLVALIVVITVASVSVLSVLLYTGFFESTYNHGPIRITNDQEFTKENGVTEGSGTEEDPYIIEGWRIGPSETESGPEGAVVLVKDVSRHFVIRDTHITGPNMYGVLLDNCRNGTIQDSTFTLCYQGVYLEDCGNCAIRDNNLSSCPIGMTVSGIDTTLIEDNRFHREVEGYPALSDLGIGLRIYSPVEEMTISGNRFYGVGLDLDFFTLPDDGSLSGLTITESNTVNGKPVRFFENQEDVTLSGSPVGQVIMFNCRDSMISQLEITQVGTAISLYKVDNCRISDCILLNTSSWMGGIWARDSDNITIRSNSASDAQIYLINCSQVAFEDNEVTSQFGHGLRIQGCDNVTIRGNLIHNCVASGTTLTGGENITVTGNTILANGGGIFAWRIYNLRVFCNDFIDNNKSVDISATLRPVFFHNDTLGMGNYWSDYDGLDENEDGIGDTPYVIAWDIQDDYPLMTPANS
ncbi:MAG: right-handed parallel beta-helix repeat-containing protein [Thermoplasmata archaeon]|nr:right-handed parallel beta-helix repeat-containing protein [Thermoplasmata archaeon]